jgi:hypothetical protein
MINIWKGDKEWYFIRLEKFETLISLIINIWKGDTLLKIRYIWEKTSCSISMKKYRTVS